MSDWTKIEMAKQIKGDLKYAVLQTYDQSIAIGFDHEEAKIIVKSMLPFEMSFMLPLVVYWIDTERANPSGE